MTLLSPWGLLGLLGIVALIIIYIIKPNYQQKFISTTYVWKLSLKYRKKRIPISKLRNFLIILCQILIITAGALILAQPNLVLKEQVQEAEVIAIIDSSASMRAEYEDETRFKRAVDKAMDLAVTTWDNDGIVSVIIADDTPEFLAQQVMAENSDSVLDAMRNLIVKDACAYGTSDVTSAMSLCEEVIAGNPNAQVYLYTDATYDYKVNGIHVEDVKAREDDKCVEWNAAVLDVQTELENNCYMIIVELAAYGEKDKDVEISLNVTDAVTLNVSEDVTEEEEYESFTRTEFVELIGGGKSKKVVFVSGQTYADDPERFDASYDAVFELPDGETMVSFKNLSVKINEPDNFEEDNVFDVYSGRKVPLRVQYASSKPNPFFSSALAAVRESYLERWDLQIVEVPGGKEPALEGFDFYIFEHSMPEELPSDGVVMFVNPDKKISGAGFEVVQGYDFKKQSQPVMTDKATESHPILNNFVIDSSTSITNVTVSRLIDIQFDEAVYKHLLYCDQFPVLSVQNEDNAKIVVMAFSLHYSNLPILKDFPLLMRNMFEYFFPSAVSGNAFEVNEKIELNSRGDSLSISGYNFAQSFDSLPASVTLTVPGAYTIEQGAFMGKDIPAEEIYVRIPVSESDIFALGERLEDPHRTSKTDEFYRDLLLFIAAAMLAILMLEWWLAIRDSV